MAESIIDTASATAREYLLAQVSGPGLSDSVDVPISDLPNEAPTETFDAPPPPPTSPVYESGSFAWTKTKQEDGPMIRIVGGTQKGQVTQNATYDHPCIVLKRLDSTPEGEEENYLAVSVTSYENMPPKKWLKNRSKTKFIRHSIPIDHPNSPFPWPGLRTQVKQKAKQKQKKKKMKHGLNPVVNTKGSRLPVLYLDLERKTSDWMDRWKQSYAKLDALLEIPASQLRHYKGSISRDDQPRLCYKSFCSLMSVLGLRQRRNNVLAVSELSLLYYGSPTAGKWYPAYGEVDESTLIGYWMPVSLEEDEELVGPSSGAQLMSTTTSGAPLGTSDANFHQTGNTKDHDMLDGGIEEDSHDGGQKKPNTSTAALPDVPPITKPLKESRPLMKLPKGYKDWWTYVQNHTDINSYDPFPESKSKRKLPAQPNLETSSPPAKEDDTYKPMHSTQQKNTSGNGRQKRAIETNENIYVARKRQKLDISPPAIKNNEKEDLMDSTKMRGTIGMLKQKHRDELENFQDTNAARKRLKLFDPMEDFRQQNTLMTSNQKQVVETGENVDAPRKKRRLFSAKELKEAARQKENIGVGNQKWRSEADEDEDAARKG